MRSLIGGFTGIEPAQPPAIPPRPIEDGDTRDFVDELLELFDFSPDELPSDSEPSQNRKSHHNYSDSLEENPSPKLLGLDDYLALQKSKVFDIETDKQ